MLRLDGDGNAPPDTKFGYDLTPTRVEGGHQIVQDDIGDVFVKNAFVAIRPEVEFERF
jgi:hypothetical protein